MYEMYEMYVLYLLASALLYPAYTGQPSLCSQQRASIDCTCKYQCMYTTLRAPLHSTLHTHIQTVQ